MTRNSAGVRAQTRAKYYPLLFTRDRVPRWIGGRKSRLRANRIGLNPDPNTFGECLLRGIKEGA